MKSIEVKGTARTIAERSSEQARALKAIRKDNGVPCVLYGAGENVHFTVPVEGLRNLIYTPHIYVVDLIIDGKKVNAMVQLSPVVVDKLGAGWVMKGDTRYETADDIQVYLWNQGTYYKVSLADLNTQDYKLIGWYDNQGHSAGNKIRLLVAVRTN